MGVRTQDIDAAVPGGDVSTTGSVVSAGRVAAYADTSGDVIEDGGILTDNIIDASVIASGMEDFLNTASAANLRTTMSGQTTGTSSLVFSNSPTLTSPALGTPSALVLTNATGRANASQTADKIATSGTAVTISSTAPSSGKVLTASSSTAASWEDPAGGAPSGSAGGDLGGTYPNPTVTQARGLKSATTTVSVSAATAPSSGQALVATSSSAATWQTLDLTSLGTFSSSTLRGQLTDETGTGVAVFATSPTLVTPVLGTPSSGTLTSCTQMGYVAANTSTTALLNYVHTVDTTAGSVTLTLPTAVGNAGKWVIVKRIGGNSSCTLDGNSTEQIDGANTLSLGPNSESALIVSDGTGWRRVGASLDGVSSLIRTWMITPSSANLAAAVSDETGSGALVFGTSPTIASPTISSATLTTPTLGTPSSGTLTNCTGRVNANQTADQIATGGTPVSIGPTVPTVGQALIATSSTTAYWADVIDPSVNGFRLTGVSGTPVMTSDSTSLSTIYLTPYRGNRIALWNTVWYYLQSAEISWALASTTADKPFDIFVYNDAGTLTLEVLDWTNATTRATDIEYLDGVLVKDGDATRRYVGTCRPRASNLFNWVQEGVDAPAQLDLYNQDNQEEVHYNLISTANSWAQGSVGAWEQVQTSANQVELVAGVVRNRFEGHLVVNGNPGGVLAAVAFGVNSTSTPSGVYSALQVSDQPVAFNASINVRPTLGSNYVAWLEYGSNSWYGDNGAGAGGASVFQSGMTGTWRC